MMSSKKTRWTLVVIATLSLSLGSMSAEACQRLPNVPVPQPTLVPCRIESSVAVANHTDPFSVFISMTNYPTTAPFPPPFLDDLTFNVTVTPRGKPMGGYCEVGAGRADVSPTAYSVRLDEAWSPFADEPTSDTREIIVTPLTGGDSYGISGSVCAGTSTPPTNCLRGCSFDLCVPAAVDPMLNGMPTVEFLDPAKSGAAGSPLPFDMRVHRNAYAKGVPLTVRVIAENLYDAQDLFPLEPAGLATTGYDVLGDDELVEFQCDTHYPCFVGVENVYHVTIHDGATLLFDTRWARPEGIAHATIDRSPLARQELVEILDDGTDGSLSVGEHGVIHLRLYARNPYFVSSLLSSTLATALPPGLTVQSYSLHFHDNPMDTYTPTPAELLALGTVSTPAGGFNVDIGEIVARFTVATAPPPTVFRDLFEVELYLETPASGYPAPTDLLFPGVTVRGTAEGIAKSETSDPLMVAVGGLRPPHPTGILSALASAPSDVYLNWADSFTDPGHDPPTHYRVFRSTMRPPMMWTALPDVPNTLAPTESTLDLGALASGSPFSTLHYYEVSAFNTHGSSGDEP